MLQARGRLGGWRLRRLRAWRNRPWRLWPRRRRRAVAALVVYAAVVVAFQLGLALLVLVARVTGHDPRRADLGPVHNLRAVDDRLWAGAQPEEADYRELAARGVRLVIDLRTGAYDDEREDDPELLARLGIRHLALPVKDGHVPDEPMVRRIVEEVRDAEGLVFLHCGGGVGRSTSAQASYLAFGGRDPSWLELVAVGPPSLEQLWFTAAVRPGDPHVANPVVRRVSEVLDAPRRIFSRLRGLV